MRLWSLHPSYLDTKGLVALWREALLAKHVLLGLTKAYSHHPQLQRFQSSEDPVTYIHLYLQEVYQEACKRNYRFDASKIDWNISHLKPLTLQRGQLAYEHQHLIQKLKIRDPLRFRTLQAESRLIPHPLFLVIPGDIETWEVLPQNSPILSEDSLS